MLKKDEAKAILSALKMPAAQQAICVAILYWHFAR